MSAAACRFVQARSGHPASALPQPQLPGRLRRRPATRQPSLGLRLGNLQIAQGELCGLAYSLPRFGFAFLRQFVLLSLRIGGLVRKKGAKEQPLPQRLGEVLLFHLVTPLMGAVPGQVCGRAVSRASRDAGEVRWDWRCCPYLRFSLGPQTARQRPSKDFVLLILRFQPAAVVKGAALTHGCPLFNIVVSGGHDATATA